MTHEEKVEIIAELRKEIQDELSIYIGNNVIKATARLIGMGLLALGYYLISHGYVKI